MRMTNTTLARKSMALSVRYTTVRDALEITSGEKLERLAMDGLRASLQTQS